MDAEPLTVRPDDLVADISPQIGNVDYRAAVAVDGAAPADRRSSPAPSSSRPSRAACCSSTTPSRPRASSGVEQAEIVEILDHHHIGSIETHDPGARDVRPGRLDRDARRRALPPERDGADAARRRSLLLGAVALGHRDPQLADDDRARPRRRRVPRARARPRRDASSGARCSRRTSDVSERRRGGDRHARRQGVRGRRRPERSCIAQIETVGDAVLERRDELLDELGGRCARRAATSSTR